MLDAQELAAIRSAMSVAPSSGKPLGADDAFEADAQPIALIADDHAARRARPEGRRLGEQWALALGKRIKRSFGVDLDLGLDTVEASDGGWLRTELGGTWMRCLELAGRPGVALLSIGGPLIEALAAHLLGGAAVELDAPRPPSATALSVFSPVGAAVCAAVSEVWQEQQGATVRVLCDPVANEAERRSLSEVDLLVTVTLRASGPLGGTIQILARPETLVAPTPRIEAVPVAPGAVEAVLGGVAVEVSVEMGRHRITLTELAALRPGRIITLSRSIDDPLPVLCEGVLKAHGRVRETGGLLTIEIVEAARQGGRAA
jgi:flagellar motor switch/type III secretory pathway protein FliN